MNDCMSKILRVLKYTFRGLLILIIGGLIIYNVYNIISRTVFGISMPKLFGFAFATVASGSMADEIDTGDFIVIKEQSKYLLGDVITFYDSESRTYITHRIILVSGGNYATKGDANDAPDNFTVSESAIVGKVVAVWRGGGKTVDFLQSPLGLFCMAATGILMWLIPEIVTEVIQKLKNGKET